MTTSPRLSSSFPLCSSTSSSSAIPVLILGYPERKNRLSSKKSGFGGMRIGCRREYSSWDRNDERGRSIVDESMIVLRKRIHEMKTVERNYEPPQEWMEWEKQLYGRYDEDVCKLVGILQMQLMNTRPSVALGAVAFLLMSLSISTSTLVSLLLDAGNGILSTIHLA